MIRPLYLNQDTERERTRIHIGAFEFEFRKSKVDYPGSVNEVAFFMSGRYIESTIEELVDVEILVQQLHYLMIGDDVVMSRLYVKTKEMKVARQLMRIAGTRGDEIYE